VFIATSGPGARIDFELNALEKLASEGKIGAMYCEFPTNPLLTVPPLERLAEISHKYCIPLIVDETLGSMANVRLLPYTTAVVTSLTKSFSGEGTICAGSVVWNPNHPAYRKLFPAFENAYEDQMFEGDAVVLEQRSRDFLLRARTMSSNAEKLVEFLSKHPAIEAVYYPNQEPNQKALYDLYKVHAGGYGGLFSMVVKGGEPQAARVFDALRVSKGPSLGTNFTLACPYTLLAHYKELDKVAEQGLAAHLIRVSVGLEEADDLIGRFRDALEQATAV
jgi:cystathionine gamma-synthase